MLKPVSPRAARLLGLAGLLAAMAAPACAQDYEHVAPKTPAPHAAPTVAPPPSTPPAAAAASAGDQVLIPTLKGIVFRSAAEGLVPEGVAPEAAGPTGVLAAKLALLADPRFQGQMRALVGKPLTFVQLAQITAQTRSWLSAHNHPFIDVTVPPQNVTSGVLQVMVTEFRLGEIVVTGDQRHFSDKVVLAPNTLKPGQALTRDDLQSDLDRLNENPFLSVDAVFKPGATPGTTDLQLKATDRLPVRVYAGYDNQGYRSLGIQEWNAGINWGNAFGTGQILSYQYTRSFTGRFTSHSASDVILLPWQDKLLVFGSYATIVPLIADGFNNVGHSGQASVRYVHTLPRLSWLTGHIQIGYDYKTTNNNLEFLGFQVLNSLADVHQFPLVYDGTQTDPFGSTAIENDLIYAPGNLTDRNTDAAFQTLMPGATARYLYDRLSLTRTTLLPKQFSWIARGIIQRSGSIVPNSEQLGGGGVGSVRGYYPDTALGSDGEVMNQELRFPAISPARLLAGKSGLNDLAQLGLFYDYASVRQPKLVLGGSPPADLASTGFFIHYTVGRKVDVNFDMGWQLRPAPGETKRGSYAAIAAVFGF